jgi:hypothetical protein
VSATAERRAALAAGEEALEALAGANANISLNFMKTHIANALADGRNLASIQARRVFLVFLLPFLHISALRINANDLGKAFSTPSDAARALGEAAAATNRAAFTEIFGPHADWLENPDAVQGANERADFEAAFNATNNFVKGSDSRMILVVGTNAWPFPVPLVKTASGWSFDIAAGREEIINRRIGRNELEVLHVMRTYVEAQREYASHDRDGDEVLEYAQQLMSSPGQTDGLYWPSDLNGETSPLGPLIARAQAEGYGENPLGEAGPQPFYGYLFKILKRQGKHAPGGEYDYVTNGNMIGGFALVAWPAEYGKSGVMTFIVNQQARVYQQDFGKDTSRIARAMKTYDPDSHWQESPD